MRRPVLTALVATLLLLGGGVATAAWRTTNTGTATARAGAISAPTGVTASARCGGSFASGSLSFTWKAPEGASSYQYESTPSSTFSSGILAGSSSTPSATVAQHLVFTSRTLYFRVRASAGARTSGYSEPVRITFGPC